MRVAPDLIFVFRGPILRCSKGNLLAKVKRVVWHEVAHWLGHNEVEVKELGLSLGTEDTVYDPSDREAPITALQPTLPNTLDERKGANEQQRCLKCYSTDVACRELDKPLTPPGAWLSEPILVHARICTCRSCGYEWDDDDNT